MTNSFSGCLVLLPVLFLALLAVSLVTLFYGPVLFLRGMTDFLAEHCEDFE